MFVALPPDFDELTSRQMRWVVARSLCDSDAEASRQVGLPGRVGDARPLQARQIQRDLLDRGRSGVQAAHAGPELDGLYAVVEALRATLPEGDGLEG